MDDEDPVQEAYLRAVGTLTTYAAITDAILFSTFVVVSGIESKVAQAAYYTLDAIAARKTMINRVLHVVGGDDQPLVQEVIEATEVAHAQRNELAHSLLLEGPDDESHVRYKPRDQQHRRRPITDAYLRSLLDPARDATMKATEAYRRLCRKRRIHDRLYVE